VVASAVTLFPALFSPARFVPLKSAVPLINEFIVHILASQPGLTPLNILSLRAVVAMILLGVVNTFVAYLFYYFIVRELGVARAAMVTYVIPPVGVILGALLLQERVGSTLLAGAGLIFFGIAIVNLRLFRRAFTAGQPGTKPA
jgi:drug/metabolite transporter (DMT)-like permease